MESEAPRERQWDEPRIQALWRALHQDIRRRGFDSHDADDVTQEAWLRTFRHPPKEREHLRRWLRIVGLRVLGEWARQERWRTERERRAARGEAVLDGSRSDESRIMRLVGELPSPYREVVTLRYVDDLEVEEIARRHGTTPATVRSQVKRALDRLRVRIGEVDEESGERKRARVVVGWLRGLPARGRALIAEWPRASLATGGALAALLAWAIPWSDRAVSGPSVARIAGASDSGGLPVAQALREAVPAAPSLIATEVPATPTAGQYSGTVRHPDGTPAAGASVWRGGPNGITAEFVAVTDGEGRFSCESVELTSFLWATHPDWLPSRRSHVSSSVAGSARDLVLSSPDGRLELVVRQDGRPVSGAEVELDWGYDHPATALLSSTGRMQIEIEDTTGKTDEQGRLVLLKASQTSALLRVRVPGRANHVETLSLEKGDSRLELALPRPGTLAGVVSDPAGAPAVRARLELRTGGGMECLALDADETGAFQVALDPGPFELRVEEDPARGQGSCRVEGAIEAGERKWVGLQLAQTDTLRGRAFAAGKPLAGAVVRCVLPWTSGPRSAAAQTSTVADGSFSFPGRTSGEEVTLQLYSPSLDLLCERGFVRVGGGEVVLSTPSEPAGRTLELEFFSEDPTLLPTLLELRTRELREMHVLGVDPSGRCTVVAPETLPFTLAAWVPGLGMWEIESSELSPESSQRLRIPPPGWITFHLDLPPGASLDSVRGGMRADGFAFTDVTRGLHMFRELSFDPSSLVARVRVFPGQHRYFFQAPGQAQESGVVAVAEGQQISQSVAMEPGVEAEVTVYFRNEARIPVLALIRPDGWSELEGVPAHVLDTCAVFRVSLPLDTLGLEAYVRGRKGSVAVLPGQLATGQPLPSFWIELGSEETYELGERRRQAAGSEVGDRPRRAPKGKKK